MMDRAEMEALFRRAREAADIESVAGVTLYRAGRRMRGECPLCGASTGKKAGGAFSVDPDAGLFKCFACDAGGDVVALAHALRGRPGESLVDTARRLAGDAPAGDAYAPIQGLGAPRPDPARRREFEARRRRRQEEALAAAARKADFAARLWREAAPAAGSPVETYLRGRGLGGPALGLALGQLRAHPAAYHSGSAAEPPVIKAPAMIARPVAPGPRGRPAPTGGAHATYLHPSRDGRRAPLDPSKVMWGPQGVRDDADVLKPGGVWLTPIDAPGPLVVGEGIESTLSAVMLLGRPCRAVATLSLRALQGGWLADKWGRRDPDFPRPDPAAPAFTWPEPAGHPWGEVILAVDRDMSPIRIKVRKAMGGTADRPVDGETRARICGGLAAAAWRAAGANAVRIIAPAPGRDFNDELRARLAAGGAMARGDL